MQIKYQYLGELLWSSFGFSRARTTLLNLMPIWALGSSVLGVSLERRVTHINRCGYICLARINFPMFFCVVSKLQKHLGLHVAWAGSCCYVLIGISRYRGKAVTAEKHPSCLDRHNTVAASILLSLKAASFCATFWVVGRSLVLISTTHWMYGCTYTSCWSLDV